MAPSIRHRLRQSRGARDRWQILGTLWDGSFRFRRQFELEGVDVVNIGIKGVGHTELVRTEKMVLLKSSGVLARL
jgi:hypothetical protein